jgi:hypothetical protein
VLENPTDNAIKDNKKAAADNRKLPLNQSLQVSMGHPGIMVPQRLCDSSGKNSLRQQ